MLGFGAGDQDCGRNAEMTPIKFLPANDVLEWNAGNPVTQGVFQCLRLLATKHAIVMGIKILTVHRQALSDQDLRGESRVRYSMRLETLGRRAERFANSHSSSFLRRSAWK